MKFKIPQTVLNQGVNMVQRSISTRNALQILDGILIHADDKGLRLTGTNLDMSIDLRLPAEVESHGRIVVNSRLFGDIIKKLPDAIVKIEVEKQTMNIRCAQSDFNIVGNLGEEYPSLPQIENTHNFTLPASVLRQAIRQTVFAVSQDDFRPIFTGVLFEIGEEKINVVALDGYRLAKRELYIGEDNPMKIIVPGKSLVELSRILEETEEDVTMRVAGNQMVISIEKVDFYSILLEGQFFHYEDILRDEHQTMVEVERRALIQSLERASLLAREEKANLVKLLLNEDGIEIQSNSEVGHVKENVMAKVEGEDLRIAFNSRYLLEGLRNIDEDVVRLGFNENINPCIIKGLEDESYLYLVLPVRLADHEV